MASGGQGRPTRTGREEVTSYATVPRAWQGETVVCIGSGPSLTQADVDACRGRTRVLVVNDGYRLAPWADALYACDHAWWRAHDGVPDFAGAKYGLDLRSSKYGVQILRNTGESGLETDPTCLRTGRNSGAQAIGLAVHYGAKRIMLLGYDMQRTGGQSHWFGEHPQGLRRPPLSEFLPFFDQLVPAAKSLGVEIVNCSRETAIKKIPRATLQSALEMAVAA